MRGDSKQFFKSGNGKVRLSECPYSTLTDERVWLTAAQYAKADRCKCNVCWVARPEYYWVETYVWERERVE